MMLKSAVSTVVIGCALVASGCAGVNNVSDATDLINGQLKSATDAVNDWVGPLSGSGNSDWKPISERVGRTSIKETKLDNIFGENPYNENAAPERQYPRVALTIKQVPDHHNHLTQFNLSNKITAEQYEEVAGCWDLSATVWENYSNSETVDFGWCYPDDQDGTVHGRLVSNWISFGDFMSPEGGDTGRKRTTGPLPPRNSFPDNLAHKKFLSIIDVGAGNTYDLIMLGSIMDHMGFDYTITEDTRFWVVRFDEAK